VRVRLLAPLLLAVWAGCSAGCSSAPDGPEILSWQLADGRDCATAGVTSVEARTSPSLRTAAIASANCSDGVAPATFTIDEVPAAGRLYLAGVDPIGVELYHGELALDAAPPGTGETRLVTLYAAAAE
jgi:hypothetical protein